MTISFPLASLFYIGDEYKIMMLTELISLIFTVFRKFTVNLRKISGSM